MKTQKEIRAAFWKAHPDLDRKKTTNHAGNGKMYCADTRCVFVDYVDYLCRSGEISDKLAGRVTL